MHLEPPRPPRLPCQDVAHALETSGSSRAMSRGVISATVTLEPNRRYIWANSSPMYFRRPRPGDREEVHVHDRDVREVRHASTPGIGGMIARPPTLMKIVGVPRMPFTPTVVGDSKRACPLITVTPRWHATTPRRPGPALDDPSLRALTPSCRPHPPADRHTVVGARRARYAAYALATSVLVGMQPVLTQVPPKLLRSTIATFRRRSRAGPRETDPPVRCR